MNQPVYKNQVKPAIDLSGVKKTTTRGFTHTHDTMVSMAQFNSICDKMAGEGYEYHEHIELSLNTKLLVFKQV